MKLRRKTPKEREQQRVEQAEYARRVREGEPVSPDPLRNPNVVVPDPEVLDAQLEHRQQSRALKPLPDPDPTREHEPFACEKHQFRGPVGRPTPVASLCPHCQAEWAAPKPVGPDVWVDGNPQREFPDLTVEG
jgi:hypothetical protein